MRAHDLPPDSLAPELIGVSARFDASDIMSPSRASVADDGFNSPQHSLLFRGSNSMVNPPSMQLDDARATARKLDNERLNNSTSGAAGEEPSIIAAAASTMKKNDAGTLGRDDSHPVGLQVGNSLTILEVSLFASNISPQTRRPSLLRARTF